MTEYMPMQETGSRAALVAKLRDEAEGWSHLCKPRLSEAASKAADDLEAGSLVRVTVGHCTYTVTESSDVAHTDG